MHDDQNNDNGNWDGDNFLYVVKLHFRLKLMNAIYHFSLTSILSYGLKIVNRIFKSYKIKFIGFVILNFKLITTSIL